MSVCSALSLSVTEVCSVRRASTTVSAARGIGADHMRQVNFTDQTTLYGSNFNLNSTK